MSTSIKRAITPQELKDAEEHGELYMPTFSPRHHENQARCKDGEWPCFICGKPCNSATVPYWVRTFQGAYMCSDSIGERHGDTGFHPIGASCYRKLPAAVKRLVRKEVK